MSVPFPLPDTHWAPTRPFWEAAARQELAIPRCAECGAWNWYPPERCRHCESRSLAWTPTSGRGTLFSWALVRRAWVKPFAPLAPYATGLVALEEDPRVRIATTLVDCDPQALRIDLPLRAVFRPFGFAGAPQDVLAPMFTPAA